MKTKNLKEKGITLIALVITIIVLLILAGVTISIAMKTGIMDKAEQSVDMYSEQEALEQLKLALLDYKAEKIMTKENIKLLDFLIDKFNEARECEEDNRYYEVVIGDWLFWVKKDTLEIEQKGRNNPIPATSITLTNGEVQVEKSATIPMTLEPSNASLKLIEWTSSNPAVAIVKNGVVTGVAVGSVKITGTSKENASITSSCTIEVKPIPLTGIELSAKTLTLGTNTETETLTVKYTPENATYKNVTWEISDKTTDVITVDNNGVITVVAAGTKTVTVTSVEYPSLTDSCTVTVEEVVLITTANQLKEIATNVNNGTELYKNKKVVLANDIDLNPGKHSIVNGVVKFASGSEQWGPIGKDNSKTFKGKFDGQGYTISGLYVPNEVCAGLFGYVNNSLVTIENVILKDCNIRGRDYVGGICGCLYGGVINKCAVYGNVTGYGASGSINMEYDTGGIVGRGAGTIKNCINYANINQSGISSSKLGHNGGILGSSTGMIIINCYNAGSVTGDDFEGGIYGGCSIQCLTTVKNCFNVGQIISAESDSFAGGLVGLGKGLNIQSCYNSGSKQGSAKYWGEIIGKLSQKDTNSIDEKTTYLLKDGTQVGIGYTEDSSISISGSETLPDVLDVINGENAFTTDDDDNIILYFPSNESV